MADDAGTAVGTTALLVELVVVGAGALVAGVALFDAAAGTRVVGSLRSLGPSLTAAAVAVSYVLGVVVDRVADAAGEPLARRWRHRHYAAGETRADGERRYRAALLRVLARPELERRLAYGRSRLRVCRGAALDCVLGLVAVGAYAWSGPEDVAARTLLVVLLALAVVLAGCLFAWRRLADAQYREVLAQGTP